MTPDSWMLAGGLLAIIWALFCIRDAIDRLTDWIREGKE